MPKTDTLKNKINKEMVVDYSNSLEKYFDMAKQFIKITKEGKIDVIIKDKINGKEQLLLYMIGKVYAQEAGLSQTNVVGNKEFLDELGIPEGSLRPWLKDLRDHHLIEPVNKGKNVFHKISINYVENTLQMIDKKIHKTK